MIFVIWYELKTPKFPLRLPGNVVLEGNKYGQNKHVNSFVYK